MEYNQEEVSFMDMLVPKEAQEKKRTCSTNVNAPNYIYYLVYVTHDTPKQISPSTLQEVYAQ